MRPEVEEAAERMLLQAFRDGTKAVEMLKQAASPLQPIHFDDGAVKALHCMAELGIIAACLLQKSKAAAVLEVRPGDLIALPLEGMEPSTVRMATEFFQGLFPDAHFCTVHPMHPMMIVRRGSCSRMASGSD